ncbi:MAG TPA: hypothetical protein VGE63_03625 [Candidatus Paceibacterota bacterium]
MKKQFDSSGSSIANVAAGKSANQTLTTSYMIGDNVVDANFFEKLQKVFYDSPSELTFELNLVATTPSYRFNAADVGYLKALAATILKKLGKTKTSLESFITAFTEVISESEFKNVKTWFTTKLNALKDSLDDFVKFIGTIFLYQVKSSLV